MRPPRLIFLVFCFIFCPIFFTLFSAFTSSPRVATPNALADQTGGLHALFSFNIPTSLFPPSAIISLTDDNSTFFLARPAAFGPALPEKGLSGQLWIGSGFGEGSAAGAEGELGCSDIPGWGEGDTAYYKQDRSTNALEKTAGKSISNRYEPANSQASRRADSQQGTESPVIARTEVSPPSTNDGTDDHLHHPLPGSVVTESAFEKRVDYAQNRPAAHADIQSLQESAEIAGKVVLLSRGGCGFLEKVKWVQRRGGVGLIVGDDTPGGSLVTMYARGDTSNVTIPAIFTSHTTAHLLSSLVPPQVGEDPSQDDPSKASRTRPSTQTSAGKSRAETSTASSALPTPTSIRHSQDEPIHSHPSPWAFRALWSLLGFSSSKSHPPEDSRRPPSSGNINWVLMNTWDEEEIALKTSVENGRTKTSQPYKKTGSKTNAIDGDGFVIGVQDWRDPDLVAPKSSILPSSSSATEQEKFPNNVKNSAYTSATLKGGSITPGSGEYRSVEKSSLDKDPSAKSPSYISRPENAQLQGSSKGWFSRLFSWTEEDDFDPEPSSSSKEYSTERNSHEYGHSRQGIKFNDHEGLWVTLTPTSMSTSPFFDTLLVLVISPLLTLTVVYALLLLRSRIRRRRWRAPKSIVERLPVRTYHTIASSSSSSASSPRACSPGSASPTAPLLAHEDRPEESRPDDVSKESSKRSESRREKVSSGSTLWRRKYTGRQVECVVCLEEYVDGQSRVMRLPCGHEFHAECITPWLTTRRRTCPICKGDVVRSMAHNSGETHETDVENVDIETSQGASSAPVPLANLSEDEMSDTERNVGSNTRLLEGHASSAPASNWRNLASSLNFSFFSGDTVWHQPRADRSR